MRTFRLLIAAADKTPRYLELFRQGAPAGVEVLAPDDLRDDAAAQVDGVVAWRLPPDFLRPFVNLRWVFGLGAGIDAFLRREDLRPDVKVVKLSDAGMAAQMTEYALLGILHWQRQLDDYRQDQQSAVWQTRAPRLRADTRVSVLGLGAIGSQVAQALAGLGYPVTGWRRRAAPLANIRCVQGEDALPTLLAATDVLFNLLPSTPDTLGLLDESRLRLLPKGAYVVNASRGDQLDAEALLRLIDAGHLSGALLDVFAQEPLPPTHHLWRHPRITITPHVAATTLPEEAAAQICANLAHLLAGEQITGLVDRSAGY